MSKTAILVDGGYYRKHVRKEWCIHTPKESADALIAYCMRHLHEHSINHELYRIFYYDCPPIDRQMYHPLKGKTVNLRLSDEYKRMNEFLSELKERRKVALRLGSLDAGNSVYTLKYDAVKKLVSKAITVDDLTDSSFEPTIGQKGVDMKLGIDIASLAYKKQVDQIVLIAGDSDFVPAAKLARREGIDFILDTMGMNLSNENELIEHIDGRRSCGNPYSRINIDKLSPEQ